jgi:hypothetical protein
MIVTQKNQRFSKISFSIEDEVRISFINKSQETGKKMDFNVFPSLTLAPFFVKFSTILGQKLKTRKFEMNGERVSGNSTADQVKIHQISL